MRTLLFCLALVPTSAIAKDLSGKVGVGFNNQFSSLSALSARYVLPTEGLHLAVEANVGTSILKGQENAAFGGLRVLYGLVREDNMLLHMGLGAGIWGEGNTNSLRLQPVVGAEFFLYGLENLGFLVEWGLTVDLGSENRVYTTSTAPSAGVHYYF
jgi:hypothetical protein